MVSRMLAEYGRWDVLVDNAAVTIITISSSTTALMLPGYAVYDATKGAVQQCQRPAR